MKETFDTYSYEPHFQPYYKITTIGKGRKHNCSSNTCIDETLVGFEALSRKINNKGKVILTPDDYIPELIQSGHMPAHDLSMLRHSCQFLAQVNQEMRDSGVQTDETTPLIKVGVNLSMQTLTSVPYDDIRNILEEYSIQPNQLEFEVIEDELPGYYVDHYLAYELLDEISQNGHTIAIDDFSQKAANFERIEHMKFASKVKVDKVLNIPELANGFQGIWITQMLLHAADERYHHIETIVLEGSDNNEYFQKHLDMIQAQIANPEHRDIPVSLCIQSFSHGKPMDFNQALDLVETEIIIPSVDSQNQDLNMGNNTDYDGIHIG